MGRQKLFLCLIFLQLSIPTFAVPGFFSADDPTIPAPVRIASKSVFKIISQGGEVSTILDMSNSHAVSTKLEQINKDNSWWEKLQVEQCRRDGLKQCPVFRQMGEGSSFLLRNKLTLLRY